MKVLWKDSSFHSNFSDESTGLCVNKGWSPVPFWKIFVSCVPVTLELSLTLSFVGSYLILLYGEVQPEFFLVAVGLCSFFGFFYIVESRVSVFGILRGSLALLGTLYLLTPVLASLARPVSDDTIAFVVISLLALHLLSYDYFQNDEVPRVEFKAMFSTNTGLLSAIFLCSRMSSHVQVFCLMSLSLFSFALLPLVFGKIRTSYPKLYGFLGLVAFPWWTCHFFIDFLERNEPNFITMFTKFFGLSLMSINVIGPFMFWKMQRYKTLLKGQWTEAVVL